MSSHPRRAQQRLSPSYGAAMADLEQTRPEMAALIREYVRTLRSEAAEFRTDAADLRERLAVHVAPALPSTIPVPLRDDLRTLAADWGIGGVVTALDDLDKRHGDASLDFTVPVGSAIQHLLQQLGLDDGRAPRACDIWRTEP